MGKGPVVNVYFRDGFSPVRVGLAWSWRKAFIGPSVAERPTVKRDVAHCTEEKYQSIPKSRYLRQPVEISADRGANLEELLTSHP